MPKSLLHRIVATYIKDNGESSHRSLLASEGLAPKTTISALDVSDLTPQQALRVQESYAAYQAAFREHLKEFPTFDAWAQAHAPGTPVAPVKTFKIAGLQNPLVAAV